MSISETSNMSISANNATWASWPSNMSISKYELSLDLKSKDALKSHASRIGNVTVDYIILSNLFTRREVAEFG